MITQQEKSILHINPVMRVHSSHVWMKLIHDDALPQGLSLQGISG